MVAKIQDNNAYAAKVREWMREKFSDGLKCPACQTVDKWRVSKLAVVQLTDLASGQSTPPMIAGAAPVLMCLVECENCSCTLTFQSHGIGVSFTG